MAGKNNPGRDPHGNGHGHVSFYAQLKHIELAMCGLDQTAGWPSMCVRQVARLQYSAAGWTSVLV